MSDEELFDLVMKFLQAATERSDVCRIGGMEMALIDDTVSEIEFSLKLEGQTLEAFCKHPAFEKLKQQLE